MSDLSLLKPFFIPSSFWKVNGHFCRLIFGPIVVSAFVEVLVSLAAMLQRQRFGKANFFKNKLKNYSHAKCLMYTLKTCNNFIRHDAHGNVFRNILICFTSIHSLIFPVLIGKNRCCFFYAGFSSSCFSNLNAFHFDLHRFEESPLPQIFRL